MWAGVAGGLAEYFDLDPSLVRLMWVLATVLSGGLAVPVYILAWIIVPRDDRPPAPGGHVWRDWSEEFHTETQRLAEEARRVGDSTRAPDSASAEPATDRGAPTPSHVSEPGPVPSYAAEREPAPQGWYTSDYPEPQRRHRGGPRQAGILLVGLGVLLLAVNAGIFNWVQWRTMWPLIFIGLGVVLLARQTNWGRCVAGAYGAPRPIPPTGPAPARRRRGSIVGPLILIFIGGIFLLQNMGVLAPSVWGSLWRLWPLVLVMFGLELLFGHRLNWLVAIIGLIAVVFALGIASSSFVDTGGARPIVAHTYDTLLEGATQAAVTVRFGAGLLSLGPLDNAPAGQLATSSYDGPNDGVRPSYTVSGALGRLEYQLNNRAGSGLVPFSNDQPNPTRLDVRLNPSVPITTLNVQTGAADARLDLSRMQLQNVDISVGAAQTVVRLPEQGTTSVHITGGASNVTLEVPPQVAAQFRYTGGLSTFNIDQNRFPQAGDHIYRSPDYERSQNRVDVTLETGVTTIQVN
jgi:phage shock protein PspC (stress-responsive transcriptional regulator)